MEIREVSKLGLQKENYIFDTPKINEENFSLQLDLINNTRVLDYLKKSLIM